jgi:muramidase (phage lysozyme)
MSTEKAQKIARQIIVRPGGKPYQFTTYQKDAAKLLGFSHPYAMLKAIIDNDPNYEGGKEGMVELPPIIENAENFQTAEQKALFGISFKATRRAFALEDGVRVSSVLGDFSEADAFSESYGKLSRVITGPEGTSGADGYRKMFTGPTFEDFSDHPRKLHTSKSGLTSDAAGKYQFLSTTWDEAAAATGVTDFSPQSQEIAARYLIQRAGINPDAPINSKEEFIRVMNALSPVWASIPDTQGKSRYNQPVATHDELWKRYQG